MSPLSNLAVVAFAASAMAIPQAGYGWGNHGHGHSHLHSGSAISAASRYSGSVRPYGSSGSVRPTKSHSLSAAPAVPTLSQYAPAGHDVAPSGGDEGAPAASSEGAALTGANAGATSDCDEVTVTATDLVTVYVTASSGGVAASGSSSTTTITVQSTKHVTLSTTVTRGSSAAAAASSPSSISSSSSSSVSADAAAASSTGQQSVANHYNPGGGMPESWNGHGGWPHPSSTEVAPVASSSTSSSPVAAAATSSTPAPVAASPAASSPTSTSTPPPAPTTTSTTSTAAAFSIGLPSVSIPNIFSATSSSAPAASPSTYTPPAGKSGNSGKRGLAYNDASFTNCFDGASQVSWAYNWASSGTISVPGVEYVPLLWGTGSDFTGSWLVNAEKAIAAGSKTVFSFNEPDLSSQANLAPAVAAAAYKTFMMPLANKGAKLCAPAVTNGGGSMGLTWLQNFLDACKPLGCQIDCLNIHWYDSPENVAYFKSHVQQAISMGSGIPVYVSEFGVNSDSYSDAQVSSFLQEVMPWMDGQDSVAGYAYYKVDPSSNTPFPLTTNGGDASALGKIYMTYTG